MRRLFAAILCISLLCAGVSAQEEEKCVVLTFDDGPSGRFTRKLLDGLEQRDVKATFLLCGYRMALDPALTQRIFDEGHEIGLHGYSHNCMGKMCRERIAQEIRETQTLLPEGCQPAFLRPPGGQMNESVIRATKDAGLAILNWSVDPRDWATHNVTAVESFVLKQVQDGDVILLHDMSDSSVEAALMIVDTLRAEGYQFVTASQLAESREISLKPGEVYRYFR